MTSQMCYDITERLYDIMDVSNDLSSEVKESLMSSMTSEFTEVLTAAYISGSSVSPYLNKQVCQTDIQLFY